MKSITDDNTIRLNGIEALNKTLGAAGALRFLSLVHREHTDYVKVSQRLYHGQSVDDIFERSRDQWAEKRRSLK